MKACYCGVLFSFLFLSVRLLSVLRGHLFFSSPPQRPMTSDFERFSIPDCIHYIYFPILIIEACLYSMFFCTSERMGNHQIIKETNRGKNILVHNVAIYVINVLIDICNFQKMIFKFYYSVRMAFICE